MDIMTTKHVCVEHETHVLLKCTPRLPVLVVCDHASNSIPAELNELGVPKIELESHIAWDIGAGDVARVLGAKLGVPVVLASNSRLVVDCNRRLDDPTAFPEESDGIPIAGNKNLGQEQRESRANAFYWPYHHAIRDELVELEKLAQAPAIIAIHSFTPAMNGVQRPWHIGALWDKDARIAKPFMELLGSYPDVVVGDNEPYSGRHPADFTLDHHGEAEGLPHLGIEIRQDLIADKAGVQHWSAILANALQAVLSDRDIYTLRASRV